LSKKSSKVLKVLFARSRIARAFLNISGYIYDKASVSFIGRLLTGAKDGDEVVEKSIVGSIAAKSEVGSRVVRPMKRYISRSVSQSVLVSKADGFLKGFLYTAVNKYGLFFVIAGLGSLFVSVLKVYSSGGTRLPFLQSFLSISMFLVALPMLFSSSKLKDSVLNSRFMCVFLFEHLGVNKVVFEKDEGYKAHSRLAIVAGSVFAVASNWVSVFHLILLVIVAVAAVAVIYTPEIGIVLLLFVLPFLPVNVLSLFAVYIFICYFLKYIRGKRTLKFDVLSVTVLMFLCVIAVNYFMCRDNGAQFTPTFVTICFIGTFFSAVNLIKSKVWVLRCIRSLCFSLFVVSVYGIVKYFLGRSEIDYFNMFFGKASSEGMVSVFASQRALSEFIAVALFVTIAFFGIAKGAGRALSVISITVAAVCLVFINNFYVWAGIVFGIIVFMMFYGKKTFAWLLFGSVTVPFAMFYIPPWVYQNLMNGVDLVDSLKNNIIAVISAIEKYSFSILCGKGVGTFSLMNLGESGEEYVAAYKLCVEIGVFGVILFGFIVFFAFQKSFTMFSKGCGKTGRIVSLSLMSSMAAMSIVGLNMDVFADARMFLMFWLVLGLLSSVKNTERESDLINMNEEL